MAGHGLNVGGFTGMFYSQLVASICHFNLILCISKMQWISKSTDKEKLF